MCFYFVLHIAFFVSNDVIKVTEGHGGIFKATVKRNGSENNMKERNQISLENVDFSLTQATTLQQKEQETLLKMNVDCLFEHILPNIQVK